jgi:hypothetical protein
MMNNDKQKPAAVITDFSSAQPVEPIEGWAQVYTIDEGTPLEKVQGTPDNPLIFNHELAQSKDLNASQVTGGTDISAALKAVQTMRNEHFTTSSENKNKPD